MLQAITLGLESLKTSISNIGTRFDDLSDRMTVLEESVQQLVRRTTRENQHFSEEFITDAREQLNLDLRDVNFVSVIPDMNFKESLTASKLS